MADLDLRFMGNIIGLPLYVDVSGVPNVQVQSVPLAMTERDRKVVLAKTILQKAFNPPKEKM